MDGEVRMVEKKHTYDYEIDLKSDVAPARVLRMVKPGSRVLEIGAGPGSITRHLSGTLGCSVVALELDPSAIEILREFAPKVHSSDLNDPIWSERIRLEDGLFDYVIAADVLEHVYDPWKVLEGMTSLLAENGAVILSLPHVGHASVAACLVDEDFEYWPWGLLDRTHIRFFGIKNMQTLINGAGLVIDQAEFVVRTPLMTEFAARWKRMPPDVQAALQRNRYSHVLQTVTCSRKGPTGRSGLDLMDLTPDPPEQAAVEHWTRVMARQANDRSTDMRGTLAAKPIDGPRSTFAGKLMRAARKFRGK
jgi:2-polyprenyl-3-methyl-5-hydroxy-6-metoxy-1,4-benzoquinol methylase